MAGTNDHRTSRSAIKNTLNKIRKEEEQTKGLAIDGINLEKQNIEEYVVDKDAYDEYLRLKEHPIHKKKIQKLSNGESVNVGMLPNALKNKLKKWGIPQHEQDKILSIRKAYHTIYSKISLLKRKAFHISKSTKGKDKMLDLLEEKKMDDLVELFGRMLNESEIHEICVMEWKIPVAVQDIVSFKKKHFNLIQKRTEELKATYDDVRLGHKRHRLEEYSWLYDRAKRNYKNKSQRGDAQIMMGILKSVKDEVEGDKLTIEGRMEVDINLAVQQHVNEELMKTILVRQIIISRVAVKMGIPPEIITARLTNSYYSKVIGNNVEDISYDDVPRPSDETYDFQTITDNNKKIVEQNKQTEQQILIEQAKIKKVTDHSIKEEAVQIVKEQIEEVREVKNDLALHEYTAKATQRAEESERIKDAILNKIMSKKKKD